MKAAEHPFTFASISVGEYFVGKDKTLYLKTSLGLARRGDRIKGSLPWNLWEFAIQVNKFYFDPQHPMHDQP